MQGNPIQTGILESTTWISDSSYWISDSLAVELGLQITIASEIPDSLCCIPDSKAQDPGFHEKYFPNSGIWIPSLTGGERFNELILQTFSSILVCSQCINGAKSIPYYCQWTGWVVLKEDGEPEQLKLTVSNKYCNRDGQTKPHNEIVECWCSRPLKGLFHYSQLSLTRTTLEPVLRVRFREMSV